MTSQTTERGDLLDTLRIRAFPNLLYVLVHDDEGRVGLGETFYGAEAVETWVHATAAPQMLGADPTRIEALGRSLVGYVGYGGSGVETRGRSALDLALWDLLGQAAGKPLHALLGGLTRERIPVYNTCAGYRYVRERSTQRVDNWGLPPDGVGDGPYEDLAGFMTHADELAVSLLEQGITAMKIWPFDLYAEASRGTHIAAAELDRALEPLRRIRAAVQMDMDVMIELHALWDRPTAKRIIAAADEFAPRWYEDPLRSDDVELAGLARETATPIAAGETGAGLAGFRALCQAGVGIIVVDIGWCGGLTEARKVAAVAESYALPVTPHDCTGPVGFAAGTHLSAAMQNTTVQESVRAHLASWYPELVDGVPQVERGMVRPPDAPGLGVQLRDEVFAREDTLVRTSAMADVP
jgi:galactonate dehydratase